MFRTPASLCLIVTAGSISLPPQPLRGAGVPAFSDQTAAAQITAVHQPVGTHSFTAGGAVGDFNNDGWPDIYFATGGGSADKLYINDHDGTFTESAFDWGMGTAHRGTAVTVGDYDNDGWLDLYVTSLGPAAQPPGNDEHLLLRNMGGSSFQNMAGFAGVDQLTPPVDDGFGAAFGDYDLDGDLDLAVASWDGSNRLFQNDGDGTFTDATVSSGLGAIDGVFGFAPRFVDLNDDLYPELLLVGDFSTSMYFINDGDGTFTDFTAGSGTSQDGTEMGHTIADFNGDGSLDWYVTTISNNNLYINQGSHVFVNQASSAGVVNTGWGWGTVAVDIDHDKRPDLVSTSQDSGQYVFRNITTDPESPDFENLTNTIGLVSSVSGRGLANFDYDNDGDQDIVIFPRSDALKLFRNDLSGTDINWLKVSLDTSEHDDLAPHGIGALITVRIDGVRHFGRIDGGSNYLSQSELVAHFGLGSATFAESVEVTWPNGSSTVIETVAANQHMTIAPDAPCGGFEDCADNDGDNRRDDACVWWACDAGTCTGTDIPFADMGGFNGACAPDLTADTNDRFHALNCFSNLNTSGIPEYDCEGAPPSAYNVDAGGEFGGCIPDGVCDGNDAFHAINAFEGSTTCNCPSAPAPSVPAGAVVLDRAAVRLRPRQGTIRSGASVLVDAYIDGPLGDLRGYQLHLGWSGGRSGHLRLVDIFVEDRADRALPPAAWTAFNVQTAQMVAGLTGAGVAVDGSGYLATFEFVASVQARGAFDISLLHDELDPGQRTFLFPTPSNGQIAIDFAQSAQVRAVPGRTKHRSGATP